MALVRERALACLIVLAAPQAGCATVIGTAISPIAGPIDVVAGLAHGYVKTDGFWDAAWKVPVLIILSPFAGLFTGMGVDAQLIEFGFGRYPILDVLQPYYNLPMH